MVFNVADAKSVVDSSSLEVVASREIENLRLEALDLAQDLYSGSIVWVRRIENVVAHGLVRWTRKPTLTIENQFKLLIYIFYLL